MMSWRALLAAVMLALALGGCGGGGGGGASSAAAFGFDVDLAGNLRALPRPTMGALEAG